jgi:hypothetical protein
MNNTLDLRRLRLYARKELRENWKVLLLGIMALVAANVYVIFRDWQILELHKGDHYVDVYSFLILTISVSMWIVSAYMWRGFTTKNKTLTSLTLPISTLERLLFATIIMVPVVTLLCYVIWSCSWGIATPIFKQNFPNAKFIDNQHYWHHQYFVVISLLGAGAFMLGRITLGRLAALKTLGLIAVLLWLVFGMFQMQLLHLIIPNIKDLHIHGIVPWVPPSIEIKTSEIVRYQLSSTQEWFYHLWWVYCMPVLLWVVAYLKLKEKQV